MSENEDEDPMIWTFPDQSTLTGMLERAGASGLQITGGTGPGVFDLEKLADSDTYSMVFRDRSGFAKVKKGLNVVKGRLGTADAFLENHVSTMSPHAEHLPAPPPRACPASALLPLFNLTTPPSLWRAFQARTYLGEFLKEKFDDVMEIPKRLLSNSDGVSGKGTVMTPDGLFLSRACSTLWILEVKVNLEVRRLSSLEAYSSLCSPAATPELCVYT